MVSKTIQTILITLLLGFLMTSAFFIRLHFFHNSTKRSIDEIVYYRIGNQLIADASDYNTIPFAKVLMAEGRKLPDYFTQPLFKHPPLFSFMVSLSLRLFGDDIDRTGYENIDSAGYVALFFSVLTILLVYILGKNIYNIRVGILAAIFLWLDPISIICSQKVWIDSVLTFFIVLSIVFFNLAMSRNKNFLFLLCGLSIGLGTLTKYPGILALVIVLAYAGIYKTELFRNKYFIMSLFLPFIMLVPWVLWNFQVYGSRLINAQSILHEYPAQLLGKVFQHSHYVFIFVLIGIILSLWSRYRKVKGFSQDKSQIKKISSRRIKILLNLVIALVFFAVLRKHLWHSVHINFLPKSSWSGGFLGDAPPIFYFGVLLEFSFLYVLAFIAFFIYKDEKHDKAAILRIPILIIFVFFILWKNYQSRYILPAIPFLLILSATMFDSYIKRLSNYDGVLFRLMGRMALLLVSLFIFAKLMFVNVFLSFPNDMCYF